MKHETMQTGAKLMRRIADCDEQINEWQKWEEPVFPNRSIFGEDGSYMAKLVDRDAWAAYRRSCIANLRTARNEAQAAFDAL